MTNNTPNTLADVTKMLEEIEKGSSLVLRPHQVEGVKTILKWMEDEGHGGILADEMGLGKTAQAVVAFTLLIAKGREPGLVICPLSVIDHWEAEIGRFSGGKAKTFRYYGSKEERAGQRRELADTTKWNLLLTTFETFLNDYELLNDQNNKWEFAVFDEAHRIKNEDAQLYQAVYTSSIKHILLLTGTPVQNNIKELYSLLMLADAHHFPKGGFPSFKDKYGDLKDPQVQQSFRLLFDGYCLRRTKALLREVPPCSEVTLFHNITRFQKAFYRAVLTENRDFFARNASGAVGGGEGGGGKHQSLMNVLTQLRKVTCHPYLFEGVEKQPFVEGKHLIYNSGKLLILDRLLQYLKERGHKVLLFCQYSRFLDILCDYCDLRDFKYASLTGSTKSEDRKRAITLFQQPNSNVFCFLLTTKAGGIGLNLTAADTIIFLDWDFNPQNDKQASARCHRIGQTKPVKIIRLVAKHTVEEIIKHRASLKMRLSELVLGEEENDGVAQFQSKLFANMILEGLKDLEEEEAASTTTMEKITDEQLEKVVGRSRENGEWEVGGEVLPSPEEEEQEGVLDEQMLDRKAMYFFEGEDYTKRERIRDEDGNEVDLLADNKENIDEGSDSDRDINTSMATRRSLILPTTSLPVVHKPKRILTDAEKEERCKRRKELEEQRRLRKSEEKERRRKQRWKNLGYTGTALPKPEKEKGRAPAKRGKCTLLNGDATKPEVASVDGRALILHAVDEGGYFGRGGMFTALRVLSPKVAVGYELAGEAKDLHLGDAHLIQIDAQLGVVLMVVQTVNDRENGMVSMEELRGCLRSVGSYASKQSIESVHIPTLWFGLRNLSKDEFIALVTKEVCDRYGVDAFIYRYMKRGGSGNGSAGPSYVAVKRSASPDDRSGDGKKAKKDDD